MDTAEAAALLIRAQRESLPKLNERQFVDALTETFARLLHYQDSGEPDWNRPTEELMREYEKLPQVIVDRYRNDAKFHSQVTRAVAAVLDLAGRRMPDRCPPEHYG